MAKGTHKLYKTYGVVSIIFVLTLASAPPFTDHSYQWKKYQKKFKELEISFIKDEKLKEEIRNRPYEIKQIMVKYPDRVDRCTTCHLGIDNPGFKNVPQPFKTHPGKNHHPFEKFGCTVCHQGQGLGTTVEDAHGHVSFWEEPMLSKKEIQSSCNHCHDQIYLENGPVISRGKELFVSLGCHGCHKTKGYENFYKVGPSLRRIGNKVDPSWLIRWIKEPSKYQTNTQMPNFRLSEEEAVSIAAYLISQSDSNYNEPVQYKSGDVNKGQKIFRTIGCLGCHKMGHDGDPFAPNLSNVGNKVKPDWLVNWFLDPKGYNPHTIMPKSRLSIQEAQDLSAFLLTIGTKLKVPKFEEEFLSSERTKEGKKLIRKKGCTGCHEINGIEHSRVGSDLSKIGAKLPYQLDFGNSSDIKRTWLAWMQNKLKDPAVYDTEHSKSNMPTFNISEEDMTALTIFLRGLDGRVIPSNFIKKLSVIEFEIEQGKRAIAKYNCRGCHKITGRGGGILKFYNSEYYAPPPLETGGLHVGDRLKDSWIYSFLKEPTPVREWLNVKMPTFLLDQDEIYYIIRYFVNFAKDQIPYERRIREIPSGNYLVGGLKLAPVFKEQEHVANGHKLFLHYCALCHGDDGKGDTYNAVNLDPQPRDLTDGKEAYMAKQNNEHFFKVISLGGKAIDKSARMPPFGKTLSEKEVWEIIAFLRTLHPYKDETIDFEGLETKRPKTAVKKISSDKFKNINKRDIIRGKSLYKKLGCSACHKIGDQGGGIGPKLTHTSVRLNGPWIYQFLKNPQEIFEDVLMPNYGLSDNQTLRLTYYLLSLK